MSLRRPILKGLSAGGESQPRVSSFQRVHVHFPPTPEISATYIAHSSRTYDRSAIAVSPNVCSLPKRHCPDRTYVLTEGKSEALLLNCVQLNDVQNEGEDADVTPSHEYDQGPDYFSLFSSSSTTPVSWPELGDTDEPLFSSKITSNCGHLQLPIRALSRVHDAHSRGASESHENAQAALSSLIHPSSSAVERKRNVSLHDREKQDKAHSFSGEGSHTLARSRKLRGLSSFAADIPPDSGCLGGF